MERCKDLEADEILELKILEPAMGSAAFLVETTNQLADLYLERKQAELGQVIPQENIVFEKQKVRSFIADRNCFGVVESDRGRVGGDIALVERTTQGRVFAMVWRSTLRRKLSDRSSTGRISGFAVDDKRN